jgi:hypothetical protein
LERSLEALLVLAANAEKVLLAVDDLDVIAVLLGQRKRRFDGTVPTTHDEDAHARIGRRIDEPVGDVRQVFARHTKAPRRTTTPHREHNVARGKLARVRMDDEPTMFAALDPQKAHTAAERQRVAFGKLLP